MSHVFVSLCIFSQISDCHGNYDFYGFYGVTKNNCFRSHFFAAEYLAFLQPETANSVKEILYTLLVTAGVFQEDPLDFCRRKKGLRFQAALFLCAMEDEALRSTPKDPNIYKLIFY